LKTARNTVMNATRITSGNSNVGRSSGIRAAPAVRGCHLRASHLKTARNTAQQK
jgi:hypothetical protein